VGWGGRMKAVAGREGMGKGASLARGSRLPRAREGVWLVGCDVLTEGGRVTLCCVEVEFEVELDGDAGRRGRMGVWCLGQGCVWDGGGGCWDGRGFMNKRTNKQRFRRTAHLHSDDVGAGYEEGRSKLQLRTNTVLVWPLVG
jgi:hypothetical protein